MRRDDELIRRLMLRLEDMPPGITTLGGELSDVEPDSAKLAEHLQLLIDHNFIEGRNSGGLMPGADAFVVVRITAGGHDFINALRNDTVWRKTKDKVASVGGSVSLGTLTEVASAVAKGLLNLST